MRRFFIALLTLPLWLSLALPRPAQAAESLAGCDYTLQSLPAVISTPGVWCLAQDLSTSITSGYAVDIQADNVVLDCNHYKLAGRMDTTPQDAATARGVYTYQRRHITIRQCRISGFFMGVVLSGTGHLVEDNRFQRTAYRAIHVDGTAHAVRRNGVYDTGNFPDPNLLAYGIHAEADVIDNTVVGMRTQSGTGRYGIVLNGQGTVATGNRVEGADAGILARGKHNLIRNNRVVAIDGNGATDSMCIDNWVSGATTDCRDAAGNLDF